MYVCIYILLGGLTLQNNKGLQKPTETNNHYCTKALLTCHWGLLKPTKNWVLGKLYSWVVGLSYIHIYIYWLVVSNMNCIFHFIYGIILPIDELIFSRWLKPPTSIYIYTYTWRFPNMGPFPNFPFIARIFREINQAAIAWFIRFFAHENPTCLEPAGEVVRENQPRRCWYSKRGDICVHKSYV